MRGRTDSHDFGMGVALKSLSYLEKKKKRRVAVPLTVRDLLSLCVREHEDDKRRHDALLALFDSGS